MSRLFRDTTFPVVLSGTSSSSARAAHSGFPPCFGLNSGLLADYDKHVDYTIRLRNTDGETLTYRGTLGPQATDFGAIDTFFPEIEAFLGGAPAAMAVVESTSDLAIVQFSNHQESGVFSAEHFMALNTYHDGDFHLPCGS